MNTRMKIVGLGAGGHAKVVLDVIQLYYSAHFEMVGFLDSDPQKHGSPWYGFDVLGSDGMMADMADLGVTGFFVGLGSVGSLAARIALFEAGRAHSLTAVSLRHGLSILAPTARLGTGSCLLPGVVVNADAEIGTNVCVNTGAIVEHDCVVGDHSFIGPGAILSGAARLGRGVFIGAGAVVRQGIRLADHTVVGAGAVVIRDVPEGRTVVGVPAKELARHG